MATKTIKRSSVGIAAALRKRFPANAYSVIFEVGNATGMNCNRHADAIAMSLWPSRGLDLIGFEFKASRTDWKKELDNPEKSEAILQFCDAWYLAVTDEAIVHAGELPESWGLLALKNGTLKQVKPAPKLIAKPWTRDFLAAMLRRVSEPIATVDSAELMKAREQGRSEESERSHRTFKQLEERITRLTQNVISFESKTGVKIDDNRYSGASLSPLQFSQAIKALSGDKARDTMEEIKRIDYQIESMQAYLRESIAGIEKLIDLEKTERKPQCQS